MNILDGIFLVIIILSFFRGILRGLIKEVTFILGLALAFLGASQWFEPVRDRLLPIVPEAQIATTVSYVLLFFAIFLAVLFVGTVVRYTLQAFMLGWLDRLGGGFLGVVKGILLCAVTVLLLMTVFTQDAKVLRTSRVAPYVIRISGEMSSYVPEDYKEKFYEIAEDLQEAWQDSDLSLWLDGQKEGDS